MYFLFFVRASCLNQKKKITDKEIYPAEFKIFKDTTGRLKFDEIVKSSEFVDSADNNFGFMSSVLWVKFRFDIPKKNKKLWFLEIGYPLLDEILVYIPDEKNHYSEKRLGTLYSFHDRDFEYHNFLVRVGDRPGSYTCYLRVKTETSLSIPLKILSYEEIISRINTGRSLFGMLIGGVFFVVLIHLLIGFAVRERYYFYFFGYGISMIFVALALSGYGFQFIWPEILWLNEATPSVIFIHVLFMMLFCRNFLRTRAIFPVADQFIGILIYYSVFCAVLSFFLPYSLMIAVSAGSLLLATVAMLITSVSGLKKSRQARFYLYAFSVHLVASMAAILSRFGILSGNTFALWGFQVGAVISVSLFSIALADRLLMLKNGLEELNANLEDRVKERTEELLSANRDLAERKAIYEKDMNMAASVQKAFLPELSYAGNGLEIASLFKPASSVSGDFYDFYRKGGVPAGLGVFDVSGHGLSSGLVTLIARSTISRTFRNRMISPLEDIIYAINKTLIREIGNIDNYITGILVRFTDEGFDYVNCGHPDLMLKKADSEYANRVLSEDGTSVAGPFLGIDIMEGEFQSVSKKLGSGDFLLLYSDCLLEEVNEAGESFGYENILKAFSQAPFESPQAVLDFIIERFYAFVKDRENLSDDLTVLVVKKK